MTYYVLDIETSKELRQDGKPFAVWLSYGVIKRYSRSDKGTVTELTKYRFRTYQELHLILSLLNKSKGEGKSNKKYMFVHNLSYEFDFILKNLSKPLKMLCNNSHKVISCEFEKYDTITFRCTYTLSMNSLRKIGEMLGFPKLTDDYSNIYPKDNISEEKWLYCERDCDVVAYYVSQELKKYKNLYNLPYTSTGKVRKELQRLYNEQYSKENPCDWDLAPSQDKYEKYEAAFWGGISISNPPYTGYIVKNMISYDNTSQYPYVLLARKYPQKMEYVDEYIPSPDYSYVLELEFEDIYSLYEWQWLSSSKCIFNPLKEIWSLFNGKIIHASRIEVTMTNVDFELLKKTYAWKKVKFISILRGENKPIPEIIQKLIIENAEIKTKLKKELAIMEDEGKAESQEYVDKYADYMRAKSMLNGIYGMFVQSLVDDEYIIDTETYMWTKKPLEYAKEGEHLRRNYLFGIFCTAYARECILNFVLNYCPTTLVYIDTDSAKFICNNHDEWAEEIRCNDSVEYLSEYVKDFGVFEREHGKHGYFEEFITFGAKKYAYKLNGHIHTVIAGLPKVDSDGKPKKYIDSLDELCLDMTFSKCKKAHSYLYNDYMVIVDDEYDIYVEDDTEATQFYKRHDIISAGGCAIYESDYTLSMTDNDLLYIKEVYKIEPKKRTDNERILQQCGA